MKLVLRCFFVVGLLFSQLSFASSTSLDLRTNYQKWLNSYQSLSFDEQKALLDNLQNYPLYPYAAVQFFQNNINVIPTQMVSDFVNKNNDFPLTSSLIQSYLAELTKRQDWDGIVIFPKDSSMVSNCRYQYALLQQGNTESVFKTVETLWLTGKELPSACDPLLDEWTKAGNRTANAILLRIGLAVESNNLKLAKYLANLLPDDYKTIKSNLLALFDNPRKLADFSKNVEASSFTRQIVLASFSRLAKTDIVQAELVLPLLIKKQNLTETDKQLLQKSLVNNYFNDAATAEQIKSRDDFISKSGDTSLIEKRIRLAIDKNDYTDIAYWISQLSAEDQLKDDWQYWQAKVLLKNNKESEAKAILNTLSSKRGFYGMVSAQMLGKRYQLNNLSKVMTKSEQSSLQAKYDNNPTIERIKELRYWGMLAESMREWRYTLNNQSINSEYLDLAKYANNNNWGDLSVQATIAGKLWDNWTERLPIMYKDLYNEALKDKSIPLSYALAITRQESALDTTVQSPVGASGLMQLMPATAKETAKKISSLAYYSPSQLFDPRTNIQLGVYYLNSVYSRNDENRVLASAAYNAGPNRVKRWLQDSDGKLDVVEFIDSIPFTETRNYVKNVLVYDYIYRIILQQQMDGIFHASEFNRQY